MEDNTQRGLDGKLNQTQGGSGESGGFGWSRVMEADVGGGARHRAVLLDTELLPELEPLEPRSS